MCSVLPCIYSNGYRQAFFLCWLVTDAGAPSWSDLEQAMVAVKTVVQGLVDFAQNHSLNKKSLEQQVGLIRYCPLPGSPLCPPRPLWKGTKCRYFTRVCSGLANKTTREMCQTHAHLQRVDRFLALFLAKLLQILGDALL